MKRSHFLKLLLLVLIMLIAVPAFAHADQQVKFTNKTSKTVSFAVRYKDIVSGEWVTRGWYNVDALSNRTITISTNNSVAYWYGYAGKSWWGGKEGASTTKKYKVVNVKFLVKGNNTPSGNNLRTVNFKEVRSNNGLFNVSITGN